MAEASEKRGRESLQGDTKILVSKCLNALSFSLATWIMLHVCLYSFYTKLSIVLRSFMKPTM